jgi:uncharacterized protein
LLERIQSPIIYIADETFLTEINNLARTTYSKIATMHHYLSMAKKVFSEVNRNDEVKLKKLFYALRAAIACKWILEKDEMPPIEFPKMIEQLQFESNIKQQIYELIVLKSFKEESYIHKEEKELNLFIENLIGHAEKHANSLPSAKGNIENLNHFFRYNLSSK